MSNLIKISSFATLCMVACLVLTTSVVAQDITFNKKNGEYKLGQTVIARLATEKVTSIERNYILTTPDENTELLRYELQSWQDTFGSKKVFWYEVKAKDPGYQVARPNFTGSMNTFNEVGEHILSHHLLQADGSLSPETIKEYFQQNLQQHGDYRPRHLRINDSLMQLVAIPADLMERDMRKGITANASGKIGQGNVVIGYWELVTGEDKSLFKPEATYLFELKNTNGGIVCVAWIEISGARIFTFKDGIRSPERRQGIDLTGLNPVSTIQGQQAFVATLARQLVKAGLL